MDRTTSTTATTAQTKPQWGGYDALALRNACEYEHSPALFVGVTDWYKLIHRDVEVMLTGFMCC